MENKIDLPEFALKKLKEKKTPRYQEGRREFKLWLDRESWKYIHSNVPDFEHLATNKKGAKPTIQILINRLIKIGIEKVKDGSAFIE